MKPFFAGQAKYMRQRGIEIHIATALDGLSGGSEPDGIVAIHSVDIPRNINPLRDLRAVLQLLKLIKRLQPDLVHGHTPKGGLIAMIASFVARTPRIYHVRGLPFSTARGVKRRLLMATEKISLTLANKVLCISQSLQNLIVEERLCRQRKILIPGYGSGNGIDARMEFNPKIVGTRARAASRDSLGIPSEAQVIGFVGRLIKEKGICELVDAFAELEDDFSSLHLLLVGPLDERDEIPSDTRHKLQSDPHIHLTGFRGSPAQYYAAMDVMAFPTYREGFGAVALEAGAMQIPVVATRVTGCIDSIIEGKTGMLVEPCSAHALAAGIRRYLNDSELRTRHGANARQHVLQRFQPELVWADVYDAYQSVLQQRNPVKHADAD